MTGGAAGMAAMGLVTAVLAPAVVLLARDCLPWPRALPPAPVVGGGFLLAHAAITIAMTRPLPAGAMAGLRVLLLAGAVLFWLPVLGPAPGRLSCGGRCVYLFIAGPVLDLAAVVVIALGDERGGLAMMVAMLPVGVTAMALTWRWVTSEERAARAAESAEIAGIAGAGWRADPAGSHQAGPDLARAAPGMPRLGISRRHLQVMLGVLWLAAAGLQAQPLMFTTRFAEAVLSPAAAGEPGPVAALARTVVAVVAADPAAWNVAFVGVQAALGVILLAGVRPRLALAASAAWAVAVWAGGECFGGLLSGDASVLTGSPGAALLYAVLAVAAMPAGRGGPSGRAQRQVAGPPPGWLPAAWATIWLMMALAGPWPGAMSAGMIRQQLTPPAGWHLGGDLARSLGALVGGYPVLATAALAGAQAVIALAALRPGAPRMASAALGSVLVLGSWLSVQGAGGLTTGLATDVGMGPPMLLLAVVMHAAGGRDGLRGTIERAGSWYHRNVLR